MLSIRTVLCPVDLSPASAQHVDVAVDLCRAFGARLVLHHNLVGFGIGSGVGWMWAPGHPDAVRSAEDGLRELMARVPDGTTAETHLTRGPVVDSVMSLARSLESDLIVLSTRGGTSNPDGSVTERILKRASLPIFVIHEQAQERRTLHFDAEPTARQLLLVPTDLTQASLPAVHVAFDLARRFAFEIHLLHVLPTRPDARAASAALEHLQAMAPPDLPVRPVLHVEPGVPADVIARIADQIAASCIVMVEREHGYARHWFRPDTSQSVLHPSPCPIWYVPEFALPVRAYTAEPLPNAAQGDAVAATADHSTGFEHRLVDELRDTEFHYWPASHVYGVVDSVEGAERALVDLLNAGVPRRAIHTWHGPLGKETIDPSGENHGPAARLWRTLEKVMPERDLLERYGAEVEKGHVCIDVRCALRVNPQAVAAVLAEHGGHLISYFSIGAVERLAP